MATNKAPRTPRKGSITEEVIGMLSAASVLSDELIISKIRAAHKGTKFDGKHLAWYKSRFRQGLLTGQKEGTHTIAQKALVKKSEPRAEKPKAKAPVAKAVVPKKTVKPVTALVPKKHVETPVVVDA